MQLFAVVLKLSSLQSELSESIGQHPVDPCTVLAATFAPKHIVQNMDQRALSYVDILLDTMLVEPQQSEEASHIVMFSTAALPQQE